MRCDTPAAWATNFATETIPSRLVRTRNLIRRELPSGAKATRLGVAHAPHLCALEDPKPSFDQRAAELQRVAACEKLGHFLRNGWIP